MESKLIWNMRNEVEKLIFHAWNADQNCNYHPENHETSQSDLTLHESVCKWTPENSVESKCLQETIRQDFWPGEKSSSAFLTDLDHIHRAKIAIFYCK